MRSPGGQLGDDVPFRHATPLFCAVSILLSACSQLPSAGPTTKEVVNQSIVDGQVQFDLVVVNDNVINVLKSQAAPSLRSAFGQDGLPPESKINVGDSVSVMIWEAGGNGLFSQ